MHHRDSLLASMTYSQTKLGNTPLVSSSTSSLTLLSNTVFKPHFQLIDITCNYNRLQKYLSKWQVLPWLKENTIKLTVSASDMNDSCINKPSCWKITSKEKKLNQGRLVLLRWWRVLLNNLAIIDVEERVLYYECILIIMSSHWNGKTSNKTLLAYRQQLKSTLINVISRLNQGALLTSVLSLCAKILAACFFKVPGLAPLLLLHLPVKPTAFQRSQSELKCHSSFNSPQEEARLRCIFPYFLNPIMSTHFSLYQQYMTMFHNELDLPASLKLESGSWIKRWRGDDSELFFSFYQHYHYILSQNIALVQGPSKHRRLHQRNATLSILPGYVYFASFISSKIESLIRREIYSVTSSSTAQTSLAHGSFMDVYRNLAEIQNISHEAFNSLMRQLDTRTTYAQMSQTSRKPVILENATRRYTSCIVECGLILVNHTAVFFDMINVWIRLAIKRTSLNEVEQVYCLFDFIEQLLVYIERRYPSPKEKTLLMDVPYILHTLEIILTKSDHGLTITRTLAFIYTHFDFLTSSPSWLDFLCLNILLSPAVFERLSVHWARHVRICYLKCLVWRVGRVESTLHIKWHEGYTLIDPLCNHSVCRRKWVRLADSEVNRQNELCVLRIHIELESLIHSFYVHHQQTEKAGPDMRKESTRPVTQHQLASSFISDVRLVHRSKTCWDEKQEQGCQVNQSNLLTACHCKSHKPTTTSCVLPILFKSKPEKKEERQLFHSDTAQEIYSLPTTITSTRCCPSYPACVHRQAHAYHPYPPTKHVYASKMLSELKTVSDGYSSWYKNPSILKKSLPELILDWPKHWNLDQAI
ncbi:hypothetical protein A0J61_01365 [Choanephora cucurbitarum]|uniref:Uncharacterized protein n=1 Tax=Choanephora cucurbitarum TaxID=101091 RepID=A0A1C7NNM7_9FUNG|nr:hypothetical protein A0J61_01365 [Choanephora cucurbitarum]